MLLPPYFFPLDWLSPTVCFSCFVLCTVYFCKQRARMRKTLRVLLLCLYNPLFLREYVLCALNICQHGNSFSQRHHSWQSVRNPDGWKGETFAPSRKTNINSRLHRFTFRTDNCKDFRQKRAEMTDYGWFLARSLRSLEPPEITPVK